MPEILNARVVGRRLSENQVYVGRPSKWGNPFSIGKDGNREEVIKKYEEWIVNQPMLLESLYELKGKDLVCWCWPESCHAEVLLRLIEILLP